MPPLMKITQADIARGRTIVEKETLSKVTYESVFGAIIYTILSQRELFKNQVTGYHKMQDIGLLSPAEYLSRPQEVWNILKGMSMNNQKMTRTMLCADIYRQTYFFRTLRSAKNKNRAKQIEIRKEFVRTYPGISFKSASMIMIKCGCTKIAIIDVWVTRFMGIKLERGITSNVQYVNIEKELMRYSRGLRVPLSVYSAAIWGRLSSYRDNIIIERSTIQKKIDAEWGDEENKFV